MSTAKKIGLSDFCGVFGGISNEDYQKDAGSPVRALSYSSLKEFAKTPAHYIAYINEDSRKETDSQRVGTLAHMAILEPSRFESEVVVIDGHRGSTAVKAAITDAEAKGKYVVKPLEYEAASMAARSAQQNPIISKLLTGGVAEQVVRAIDPDTGVLMKCRPDYLHVEAGVVIDVKTYSDLTIRSIERQVRTMKYAWQSAWYLDVVGLATGRKLNSFVHIFVEPEAPYSVRAVCLNDASLEQARAEIRELLPRFAECMRTNKWPGYESELVEINPMPDFY